MPSRVAIACGWLQPSAPSVANQTATSAAPSRVPANQAAAIVSHGAADRLIEPVETNQLFVRLSAAERATLRERGFAFYDQGEDAARFVTAWDSKADDCQALAAAIAAL